LFAIKITTGASHETQKENIMVSRKNATTVISHYGRMLHFAPD
jgi:hypothetical protein